MSSVSINNDLLYVANKFHFQFDATSKEREEMSEAIIRFANKTLPYLYRTQFIAVKNTLTGRIYLPKDRSTEQEKSVLQTIVNLVYLRPVLLVAAQKIKDKQQFTNVENYQTYLNIISKVDDVMAYVKFRIESNAKDPSTRDQLTALGHFQDMYLKSVLLLAPDSAKSVMLAMASKSQTDAKSAASNTAAASQ